MWVMDNVNQKKKENNQPYEVRKVVKTDGLYNCICREYWYSGAGNAATTYQASDAVVHQIDGVLLAEEMTPWKSKLNQVRRK